MSVQQKHKGHVEYADRGLLLLLESKLGDNLIYSEHPHALEDLQHLSYRYKLLLLEFEDTSDLTKREGWKKIENEHVSQVTPGDHLWGVDVVAREGISVRNAEGKYNID